MANGHGGKRAGSGRPKGAKTAPDTFGPAFCEAMSKAFDKHGAKAIEKLAVENPLGFLKLCTHLVPKQIEADVAVNIAPVRFVMEWSGGKPASA